MSHDESKLYGAEESILISSFRFCSKSLQKEKTRMRALPIWS